MEPLPSVPSLPSLPPTPQPSPQPSSPGGSSTVPVSSEESGPQPRSRVSVYSTASSTSGIASLGQSQLDLASMLTPTDSNTDSMHATPTPSDDVPVKTNTSARRNSLWNGALRLFRRKTRYETYTDLLLHHRVGDCAAEGLLTRTRFTIS